MPTRSTECGLPVELLLTSNWPERSPNPIGLSATSMVQEACGASEIPHVVPVITKSGLTVTAPANGNLAPPGYYKLFILNSNGVPSIAPLIQVH